MYNVHKQMEEHVRTTTTSPWAWTLRWWINLLSIEKCSNYMCVQVQYNNERKYILVRMCALVTVHFYIFVFFVVGLGRCCCSYSSIVLFSLMVGTDSISKSVIPTSCSFMYCIALFVLSARGKKKKTNQFNIFDHCTEMVDDTFRTNTSCIARSHELVLDWVLFCANITQIAIYPNGRNNASVEICDAITNQRKDRNVKCWFKNEKHSYCLSVCAHRQISGKGIVPTVLTKRQIVARHLVDMHSRVWLTLHNSAQYKQTMTKKNRYFQQLGEWRTTFSRKKTLLV